MYEDFDYDLDELKDLVRAQTNYHGEEPQTCTCQNGCMQCLDISERDFM